MREEAKLCHLPGMLHKKQQAASTVLLCCSSYTAIRDAMLRQQYKRINVDTGKGQLRRVVDTRVGREVLAGRGVPAKESSTSNRACTFKFVFSH